MILALLLIPLLGAATARAAPFARDDEYTTAFQTRLNVSAPGLLANDTAAGTGLRAEIGGANHGAVIIAGNDGAFGYEPDPGFFGDDTFQYRSADSTGFVIATVTIHVLPPPDNHAPAAANDAYSMTAGSTLTIDGPGLLGNDTDADGNPLTAVQVSSPGHGTVGVNGNGSFTYTPSPGFTGEDSFTYQATDGDLLSNVATVRIAVNPNSPPVAKNDSFSVAKNLPLHVDAPGVLANDTDADSNALHAVLVTDTTHGSLTFNSDGSFDYSAAVGYYGVDTFTYKANDGIADSSPATVTININDRAPVAVSDHYNAVLGGPTSFPAAAGVLVNDSDADGDPLHAVLVTGTSNGQLQLNADGSFTYTPNDGFVGTDSFSYKANDGSADSDIVTDTISVSKNAVVIDFQVSPNPSNFNQSVTLSAQVFGTSPTGTVTFMEGNTAIGPPITLVNSVARFDISTLAVGTHMLTAAYSGDNNNLSGTTSPATLIVRPTTTLSISASPNPAFPNQNVIFTTNVTPPEATGSVSVHLPNGACVTSQISNSSFCSHAFDQPGSYTITADYSGDSTHAPSSGDVTVEVKAADTQANLSSSLNPSNDGKMVTFTATVTKTDASAPGMPDGDVRFFDGDTQIGTGALDGSGRATFQTSTLAVGSHSITARYVGNTTFASSTSAALQQAVDSVTTSTTLTSGPNPSTFGQSVSLRATVTKTGTADGTPGGNVEFLEGTTSLGTAAVDSSGMATLDISTLAIGTHNITANYLGDGTFLASTSSAVAQMVNAIATTAVVTSSTNPSFLGQSVTFTATVSPDAAPGTVTFSDGATPICSAVPLAGGHAACSTAFTSDGIHSITAAYSGGGTYAASVSDPFKQTVNDQRGKTVAAIASFLKERNNLILSNGPDGQRQIDRLNGVPTHGGGGSASTGFGFGAPSGLGPPMTPPMGLTSAMALAPRAAPPQLPGYGNPGAGDNTSSSPLGLPWRASGSDDGPLRLNFATSLSDMLRFGEQKRAKEAAGAGYGLAGSPSPAASFMPWDFWIEGQYADFSDDHAFASTGVNGHFALVTVGADYVLSRSLLVGVMAQFDDMRQRDEQQASEVSGRGWMIGPYATLRLSDEVFLQGRALAGSSSNDVSPFLSYTDHFDSDRWLVGSTLSGRWQFGPWTFAPDATVAYIQDNSDSYADHFGIAIPEVKTSLGQAKAGPQLSYAWTPTSTLKLETYGSLDVVWNFADEASSAVAIDGVVAGPSGARGRVELGMRAMSIEGAGFDFSASYDGIGSDDFQAITGRAAAHFQFN